VVAGPPASGKSTFARGLAAARRAALLDQDVVTNPLMSVVATLLDESPHDLDAPQLRRLTREPRYDALLGTAADCLSVGTPVVLAAPFTAECADRARWQALRSRLRAAEQVLLVWVDCRPDRLLERMTERGAKRDANKLQDRAAFLARLPGAPVVPHVSVNGEMDVDTQVSTVLASGV
jgi:predicted kinase